MKYRAFLFRIFFQWLPLAFVISFVCGLTYIIDQQHWRLAANYPQVPVTQQFVSALKKGQQLQSMLGPSVDISTDQSTWVTVYDSNKNVVNTSAVFNGQHINLPQGVLDSAVKLDDSRITWQPETGIRQAIVVRYFTDSTGESGWVVAGRSLKETEERIRAMGVIVFGSYVLGLTGSFLLLVLIKRFSPT